MNAADVIAIELQRELETLLSDEVVRELVEAGRRSKLGAVLSGLVF